MKLRLGVLSILALLMTSAPVFAVAVDLSSLHYDFGAGSDLVSFAVNDGMNAAQNDSFSTTETFDVATHGNDNKHALTADIWPAETDLTGFTSLDLTVVVDPSSALDAFGQHGFFEVVGRNTDDYDFVTLGSGGLNAGSNVFSVPVSALDRARALTFQLYGGPGQNITGDVILDVVDVTLVPEPASASIGLALLVAGSGLLRRRVR